MKFLECEAFWKEKLPYINKDIVQKGYKIIIQKGSKIKIGKCFKIKIH